MSGGITEAFARSPSAEIKCAFGACVSDSHERWIRIIRIRKHIVIFATTVIDLRTFGLEKLLGGCTNEYKKKYVARQVRVLERTLSEDFQQHYVNYSRKMTRRKPQEVKMAFPLFIIQTP